MTQLQLDFDHVFEHAGFDVCTLLHPRDLFHLRLSSRRTHEYVGNNLIQVFKQHLPLKFDMGRGVELSISTGHSYQDETSMERELMETGLVGSSDDSSDFHDYVGEIDKSQAKEHVSRYFERGSSPFKHHFARLWLDCILPQKNVTVKMWKLRLPALTKVEGIMISTSRKGEDIEILYSVSMLSVMQELLNILELAAQEL